MSSQAGKTAPRLIQDLSTYDPRHEQRAGRNLLTTSPPHHEPTAAPAPAVPFRNCRHNFMVKHEQSTPLEGEVPSVGAVYKLASYCERCRWHVDLVVDLRAHGDRSKLCHQLSQDYPLHHFMFQADETDEAPPLGNSNVPRSFRFQCSAPSCPMDVRIHMRPPRFSDQYITLLTSRAHLRQRLETARQLGRDGDDPQMARPVDALDYLSTYLSDSLNPQKGKARIPLLNRKFLKTFGKDCDQILLALSFTHEIEAEDDGSQAEVWHLPKPPPPGEPLDPATERTVIEDARHELAALLAAFPETERNNIRHPLAAPQPSSKLIERLLGCADYQKKPLSGTRSANHEEDHPYYAGLGAVGDFSDALLLFAYTCQVSVDLANATYYFECLQDLAIGRKSEFLEEQVVLLASKGQSNRQEVAKAYRSLGMDPAHARYVGDDHIIGQFKARLQDISPALVEETRNMLRTIGYARHSEKIMQEASNALETYSQALSWLDVDESTPDEFVETMYTVKINDSSVNQDLANKAMRIIAEHRKSQKLLDFLVTGVSQGTGEMDVGDAYALLNIPDRTATLDLEMLRMQTDYATSQNPESKDKYEKAYELICRDQSTNHKNPQGRFQDPEKHYPLESWPVGCKNIGNTCYLNSVLQFLFTIKPVRELVLDCEPHLQEATPQALASKRVGRSIVTAEKVKKAQKFVYELRSLFQEMITANTSCVRPKESLAILVLTDSSDSSKKPAESGLKASELGNNGTAVTTESEAAPAATDGSAADSGTTHVDSVMGDDGTSGIDASSGIAEINADTTGQSTEVANAANGDIAEGAPVGNPKHPTRNPPAVPPRAEEIKQMEFSATQQDAAEMLNNIFDLLRCAFRGDGTVADNEQLDLIKRLFFSNVTSVYETNGNISRNSQLHDHYLVYSGNRNRPLHAALDDAFSLTELEREPSQGEAVKSTKYEYIDEAAPIQIINVKRGQYDNIRKEWKDESYIGLDEVLYLDRYLNRTDALSEQELLDLRNQQWQLQQRLRSLESRKTVLSETEVKMSLPDAVDEVASFIDEVNKSDQDQLVNVEADPMPTYPELPDQLRDHSPTLRKEAESLEGQLKDIDEKINAIFRDCKSHPYRLQAVFMHRGSVVGGHYWIYIYDFQNKIWRKYNDERVEEAEVKKIFEQDGNATSTGVVFVRGDLVTDLTEAVHRNPEAPVQNDIEMRDAESSGVEHLEVIDGVEAAARILDIIDTYSAALEYYEGQLLRANQLRKLSPDDPSPGWS